jgi:ribosomal protein S4
MARYTDSVCRLCRREGMKLYLKGDRCFTDKCAVSKRAYAPGLHGSSRRKLSNFGIQLREKQKADCIECGSCSFICPSKRPLLQSIRVAKAAIAEKKRKQSN